MTSRASIFDLYPNLVERAKAEIEIGLPLTKVFRSVHKELKSEHRHLKYAGFRAYMVRRGYYVNDKENKTELES